ncbi:hypothetical protein F4818DRAFT_144336 [Hypoxylon cercidicola]|nr:hypothetical protein F4818DRAFT_144336 [Hypoxylon cercidicola]
MEQIVPKELVSSRRKNRGLDLQIHQRRPTEPRPRRDASTSTDNTFSDSIFSTSTRNSYDSITSNSLSNSTCGALQQEASHDRNKSIRESRHTSNTSRRAEEASRSNEREGEIIVSNRSVSHRGNLTLDKPRRKKAILDCNKDRKNIEGIDVFQKYLFRNRHGETRDRRAHPVYAGSYPHQSRPTSVESREPQSSPSSSTQSSLLTSTNLGIPLNKRIVPVLTYAQNKVVHITGTSALSNDGVKRAAEWVRHQERQNVRNHEGVPDLGVLVEEGHVERTCTGGCDEGVADCPNRQKHQPLLRNHKAASCPEASFESLPTDVTEKNVHVPSIPEIPPSREKEWQLTLPDRARHDAITPFPNSTAQFLDGTLPTSNTAHSQPNEDSTALISEPHGGDNSTGVRKRRMGQGSSRDEPEGSGDGDKDDDDDRRDNRPQREKRNKSKGTALPFLACPYFKYDPTKYAGRYWRSCCGPGWKTVHRMKEHLYRHHRQPKFVCKRCGLSFREEEKLEDHTRERIPCGLQELRPMDGFDSKQEIQLKSRKRTVTELSEVDKWKQTYRILFPHVLESQIPSPFYDYVRPRSNILRDYQDYALQEIQGGLRPELERELEADLGITESVSKQKAVDLLKRMHLKLLQRFRNACEQGITTPTTSTSASIGTILEVSETRPSPEFLTPLSAEQSSINGDNNVLPFTNMLETVDEFGFDFDFCTDGTNLLEVMVEPFSNDGASKPLDSAYGSMSTKESSECSREFGRYHH